MGELPPPTPPAAVEPPKDRTSWPWVAVGLLVFAAIIVSAISRDRRGESGEPSCEQVRYRVTADIDFDVTSRNASGGTDQEDVTDGAFSKVFCADAGQFAYVSAQLDGDGSIECEILRDDVKVASAKSSGEYVIATCSD